MTLMSATEVAAKTVAILQGFDFAALPHFNPADRNTCDHIRAHGVFASRAAPFSSRFSTWDAMEAAELAAQKIALSSDRDAGLITPPAARQVHDSLRAHHEAVWSAILHDRDGQTMIPDRARNARFAHGRFHGYR